MSLNLAERLRRAAADLSALAIESENNAPSSDHPSAQAELAVTRYLDCFESGDVTHLGDFVHPNVTYHVPGRSRLAGMYEGVDGLHSAMTVMPRHGVIDLRSQRGDIITSRQSAGTNGVAGDIRLVVFYEMFGSLNDEKFGVEFSMRFVVRDGRIASITEFSGDQYATDDAFA